MDDRVEDGRKARCSGEEEGEYGGLQGVSRGFGEGVARMIRGSKMGAGVAWAGPMVRPRGEVAIADA